MGGSGSKMFKKAVDMGVVKETDPGKKKFLKGMGDLLVVAEAGKTVPSAATPKTTAKATPSKTLVDVTESGTASKSRRKRSRGGTIIESTGMTA
jgi:hypothetical protein